MRQPTHEQLALLTRTERLSYKIADFVNRRMRRYTEWQNRTFAVFLVSMCGGRRYHVYGLDNITDITSDDRVILVANHRSFFDFYVIMLHNFTRTSIGGRLLFPVRSTFFYDNPLGAIVNMAMSGMTMFPPIMRSKSKRSFNRYAIDRVMMELEQPSTILGFHPEGTRNKGHPYELLPARPGVGEVILRAGPGVKVVPIYAVGMGSNLLKETIYNFFWPRDYPIDLVYGKPIDFSDVFDWPDTRKSHLSIAQRCMAAIAELADFQRRNGALKIEAPPKREEVSGK